MKNKILTIFILVSVFAVLILSSFAMAQPAGKSPPTGPQNGTMGGDRTPPTPPTMGSGDKPNMNDSKPLKERLEELYTDKENYLNQKKQCKENAAKTNAAKGTCWDTLRPVMQKLLLKEIMLTRARLIQLRGKNITFDNIEEINKTLNDAQSVFEDDSSSKYAMKSAAKNIEDLVNMIEEKATKDQPEILIKQMDNLIIKADKLAVKLDAALSELKTAGKDVTELEKSLEDYKTGLAKIKEEVAAAKAKYTDTRAANEVNGVAKEVRTFVNNAMNYLQKAFDKAMKNGSNDNGNGRQGGNGGNNTNGGDNGNGGDDNNTNGNPEGGNDQNPDDGGISA